MAIINCPECNEKISDTVTQCVHCGAQLTICPECKTAYVGKVEKCTVCGFDVTRKQTSATSTDKTPRELEKEWELESPIRKIYCKKWIKRISLITNVFYVGIMGILLFVWLDSGVGMIEGYKSTHDWIVILIVIGIICDIGSEVTEHLSFIPRTTDFINWSKVRKHDLLLVTRNAFEQDLSKMPAEEATLETKALQRIIKTQALHDNPVFKSTFTLLKTVATVFGGISMILGNIFLLKNIEILMQAQMLKSDLLGIPGWSISMVEHWHLLVISIVVYIIGGAIVSIINGKKETTFCTQWVARNMPEYLDKYQKIQEDD